MDRDYQHLLAQISLRYNVSEDHIESRIASRRTKLRGLIGKKMTARTVATSLALSNAEQRLATFLAASARHVSGKRLTDAITVALEQHQQGHLSSLGYWPQPKEAPSSIAAHYMAAINAIARAKTASSISIKVDQLDFDRDLVMQVLAQAIRQRVRVHFDAQGFDTTDRTHALLEDGLALGADLSATLPSRWQRSIKDAERFIQWGIPIRIVKGQGCDPDDPKIDPRRSFLELVECVAGRAVHVGVATHDRRVAEPALKRLVATHTPCSLEQLLSLPSLEFLADRCSIPMRGYIAYGRFGLPYTIGEFARRPAILGWILRDLLVRYRTSEDTSEAK